MRVFDKGFYLKIVCSLVNSTTLYIREYVDAEQREYSYHWQDENGKLITRWDNAPHHKNIATYPHHKHLPNGEIKESFEITCYEIIKSIEEQIL